MANIPTSNDVQTALVEFERSWPDLSDNLIIEDELDYGYYTNKLKKLKAVAKDLSTLKKTMTGPIDQAKKAIMDLFADPEFRLNRAEADIKRAVLSYEREIEEQRRLAEAKARDEQRQLEEAAEARANRLRAKGKDEQADAVLTSIPPVPIINTAHDKAKGISIRGTWKAEVTNINELIASGRWEFIEVNDKFLQNFAKMTKGSQSIPGVRFYEEKGLAVRA